jgi:SRSO17 transposase
VDETAARELLIRLGSFLDQFAGSFSRRAQRTFASRYVQGLLNDSRRKSIQPMHARLADPGSYQALHHFVTHSTWDPRRCWHRLLAALPVRHGILAIDDTSFPKQGKQSVGVARQYCGALGKIANCQSAVSTALIAQGCAWLTSLELFLPHEWVTDAARQAAARIPPTVGFREKWRIALAHVRQVLAADLTIDAVVADTAYGQVAAFRRGLERLGLRYVVAVPWYMAARLTPGGPSVALTAIATQLAPRAWRLIRWGRHHHLAARFAAVRVRPLRSRGDRWLVCHESLVDGERTYYFSNLPETTPLRQLAVTARSRWAIEQQYSDLKTELGLGHFEGRSYPGWGHHAVLAAITFTFLQLERLRESPALPTFPEVRDLVRDIMSMLYVLERPGLLNTMVSFQRNPPLRI